jgi:MFS family permease
MAAIQAYISDCTPPDERSRMFSLLSGMTFIGVAIGPTVGGQLVKHSGNILTVYYFAFVINIMLALAFWFLVPNSRSHTQLAASRRKYAIARATSDENQNSFSARAYAIAITPLRPLAVFAPVKITTYDLSRNAGKRDWSLMFIAAALGFVLVADGGLWYYTQYAVTRYSWSPVEVGYWMSSICIIRAAFLVVGLPSECSS